MPPTDTFAIYDRLVPGGLEAFLTAARSEGQSVRQIAARLLAEHDVNVSSETVRTWCKTRDIAKADV